MSNFTPNQQKKEQVRRRLIFDDESGQQSPKLHISTEVDNGTNPLDKFDFTSTENIENTSPKSQNSSKLDNESTSLDKFDSTSPETTQNRFKIIDLSQMTEEDRLEQMARWNFDFENEIPLTGDWDWEKVTPVAPPVNHKEKICALDKKETNDSDRNV